MKQVCLVKGEIRVVDVPPPACAPGGVLVQTAYSVISTGTELATAGAGSGGSLLRRALANPDLVRRAWGKVGAIGFRRTADLIRAREAASLPLGYSAAGVIVEVGAGIRRFKVGDRVACAGAGYANHAAVNFVPENLVAPVPPGLAMSAAAFGTLASIALHGVRRLAPTLGEHVVVVGLGLVGQLVAQLLRITGCRVLGIDLVQARIDLARALGLGAGVQPSAEDPREVVAEWTAGTGADGVLVCAAGADVSLLNRSLDLCRPKGRLVLVGDVPIRISRDALYRKEIDVLISSSYGPGRYDSRYEEQGVDYPLPYVRWTAGRNLAEGLRLMMEGHLRVAELIAATLPVAEAPVAYGRLRSPERPLAVLLDYGVPDQAATAEPRTLRSPSRATRSSGQVVLGVIGAGVFFRGVHLPNLRRHGGFFLKTVATRSGLHAHDLAAREGIPVATTDPEAIIGDPEIEAVLIATRHDLHAPLAMAAIRAGKHVFVEKPLALTVEACDRVVAAVAETGVLLTVGFNRRFAPLAHQAKALVDGMRGPKTVLYRVNAGPLPADHWLRDPEEGGGRLLGEGVHFFDFARWLLREDPVAVHAIAVGRAAGEGPDAESVSSVVSFPDGSRATILYASQGSPELPKERIEVFGGGRSLVLDDFAALEVYGVRGRRKTRLRAPDKGHVGILADFHGALRGTGALGVTAQDGRWATWCARQAHGSLQGGLGPER